MLCVWDILSLTDVKHDYTIEGSCVSKMIKYTIQIILYKIYSKLKVISYNYFTLFILGINKKHDIVNMILNKFHKKIITIKI